MEAQRNNLLARLHKWAHRQDENFITEAFAHLLQHLLDEEPEAGVHILEAVTGGFIRLKQEEARSVELRTQIVLSEGRPDLEIRTPKQLVYVEVKAESEVNPEQLRRYRRLLADSGVLSTALVLLTRYPVILAEGDEQPDTFVRWYHVAEWLEQESNRYRFRPVSSYLVNQFLGFLGARNMVMGQVTYEIFGGVRALRTFTDMLCEAAAACGLQALPSARPDYMGIKIGANLKKPDYYLGIYFDRPEVLVFQTDYRKVDPEAAARLGIEGVAEWPTKQGHYWQRELNLQSEETAFSVRTKARQLQLLEKFLGACLDTVRRIEIHDETETPADKDDSESSDDGPLSPPTSK